MSDWTIALLAIFGIALALMPAVAAHLNYRRQRDREERGRRHELALLELAARERAKG